ncbi:MAG: hypothetical protein AB7S26_07695 [Sandaracinaceae bacterium]
MKALDIGFAFYALVCLAAITWPGFAWVQEHASLRVFGVPFALAYNGGWVALTFVVLAVYHRLR